MKGEKALSIHFFDLHGLCRLPLLTTAAVFHASAAQCSSLAASLFCSSHLPACLSCGFASESAQALLALLPGLSLDA